MKQAWIAVGGAVLGLAGCMTYEETSRQAMAGREDYLLVQEEMRRLSGRLEAVELEISRLQAHLDTLRASQGQSADAAARMLQVRIEELESRLRALDAARERDKQEIVDVLSKKVAQLVTSPPSAGAAKKQNTPRRSGPQTGYEHEVKAGESLSAIAAAYGVSIKVIMEDNDLKDPNRLRVGQKLFIRD